MYDFFNDPTQLAPAKVLYEARADGSFVLSSPEPLQPYARCIGQWLEHWAVQTPQRAYLAERRGAGWFSLNYAQVRQRVGALAQGLLELDLPAGAAADALGKRSGPGAVDLGGAARGHPGVDDFRGVLAQHRQRVQQTQGDCRSAQACADFVNDGDAYCRAIELVNPDCPVVAARNAQEIRGALAVAAVVQGRSSW